MKTITKRWIAAGAVLSLLAGVVIGYHAGHPKPCLVSLDGPQSSQCLVRSAQ